MSGSKPNVAIRIGTEGAEKAKRDFEAIGTSGEAALARVRSASAVAGQDVQKLAGGADIASRAFTGMGGSLGAFGNVADRVGGVAGSLTTAFVALGASATLGALAIAQAGDKANAALARLGTATGGMDQAKVAYEGLFRLSQQTGIAVAESAGAFTRFGVAAKEIGATNDQVLRLVSGIQKAGIVAGASTEETGAAAMQLAQALASGTLQGDELRSVLENMPQLAQALAREFGVSLGQLRKMGEEGKLTADQVFPKLLAAAESIGREFDKQPATMERAKNVLVAATEDFGARLDRVAKLSQTFAGFMLQGAAALRAMGDTVAPDDRTAAQQRVARAQRRVDELQPRPPEPTPAPDYSTAEARRAQTPIPGRDPFDTTRQRATSSPLPRDASQDRARELAEAQQELRDATAAEQAILRDAREMQRADEADAATKRVDAARANYQRIAEEVDKGLKTVSSINAKYAKEREKVENLQKGGFWTDTQAQERLKALAREQKDELESLAKSEAKGGEEARKATEKREKSVQTLQEQVDAAQRALAATQAGTSGSKAMALALEVENKVREAGIPITGQRTEAEQKAAEAIELNVRKLDELKESTKQLEDAQKKAADAQNKFVDASRTALADIPARALDRLGDSLVDAFVRGEGAAVNFGNVARAVIASAIADLAKLAVINPLMNSLFISSSGARPTLAGATGGSPTAIGGFGDLFGLAGAAGSEGIGGMLGLTGAGGLLSTSVIPGLGSATNAALGAMGGAFGPATPSAVAAQAGIFGGSGATLGSLLGGAGAGFGAGMLLNNVLGGNQTSGMIGSGVGGLAGAAIGSIIPGVGTLIGGLLGGALGGAGGGMIGPGETVKGYGYQLNAAPDGMLRMGASAYNESGAAAFQEAAQGIAALNDWMGKFGITVGGAAIVGGNKNGGDLSHATATTFGQGVSQLYYHSNDNQLESALSARGNQFGSTAELQALVEGFTAAKAAITALTAEPIPSFTAGMNALAATFDPVIAKANEYGLATDTVSAAYAKATAALEAQRAETLRQSDASLEVRRLTAAGSTQQAELARQAESARQEIDAFTKSLTELSLSAEDKAARLVALEEVQAAERAAIIQKYSEQAADALRQAAEELRQAGGTIRQYLDGLASGTAAGASPTDRLAAAQAQFERDRTLATGGDRDALGRITQTADALLSAGRDMFASGKGFQDIKAGVVAGLSGLPVVQSYDAMQTATLAEIQRLLAQGTLTTAISPAGNLVTLAGGAISLAGVEAGLGVLNTTMGYVVDTIAATSALDRTVMGWIVDGIAAASVQDRTVMGWIVDAVNATSVLDRTAIGFVVDTLAAGSVTSSTYQHQHSLYLAAVNDNLMAGARIAADVGNAGTASFAAMNRILVDGAGAVTRATVDVNVSLGTVHAAVRDLNTSLGTIDASVNAAAASIRSADANATASMATMNRIAADVGNAGTASFAAMNRILVDSSAASTGALVNLIQLGERSSGFAAESAGALAVANNWLATLRNHAVEQVQRLDASARIATDASAAVNLSLAASNRIAADASAASTNSLAAANRIAVDSNAALVNALASIATQLAGLRQDMAQLNAKVDALTSVSATGAQIVAATARDGLALANDELAQLNTNVRRLAS